MSGNLTIWMEIAFDIAYLITIWVLVYLMFTKRKSVIPKNETVARLIRWMFFLLALGDTGHVGFRVIAYARDSLQDNTTLMGIGSLATAYTITIFYMILVEVWRKRFNKPHNWFTWTLLIVGVFRMIIMSFPVNQWGIVPAPQPIGIIRNIPLMILGIGIMVLILVDAKKENDKTFFWIGWMIFLSFLFYTPVIFLVHRFPLLGMLMIPKTLAYVAIAFISYFHFYKSKK
ncbi:MAG: hypothetical protein JEZ00_20020 [Anaerolineaceae bacterium]|nr:hypothetical protein [Anaerolineaceae bacterium]